MHHPYPRSRAFRYCQFALPGLLLGLAMLWTLSGCSDFRAFLFTPTPPPAPTSDGSTPTLSITDLVNTLTAIPTVLAPTRVFTLSTEFAPLIEPPGSPPTETLTPTVTETPTSTDTPNPKATRTRTPTRTRRPTVTRTFTLTPTETYTPTITPTPIPPLSYTRILNPGAASKVTSPFFLEGSTIPGAGGNVLIEIIGEDDRPILSEMAHFNSAPGARVNIYKQIEFEIPGAAESARLQISTLDDDNRTISLSSVEITLLALGDPELTPPNETIEPFVIRGPENGEAISGGVVTVHGQIRPVNDLPVIIDLVAETGEVIGSKQFFPDPPPDGATHALFSVDVPYNISHPVNARVTIRQLSSHIPGNVAVSSVEVALTP